MRNTLVANLIAAVLARLIIRVTPTATAAASDAGATILSPEKPAQSNCPLCEAR